MSPLKNAPIEDYFNLFASNFTDASRLATEIAPKMPIPDLLL